jgi:hypothetical protein
MSFSIIIRVSESLSFYQVIDSSIQTIQDLNACAAKTLSTLGQDPTNFFLATPNGILLPPTEKIATLTEQIKPNTTLLFRNISKSLAQEVYVAPVSTLSKYSEQEQQIRVRLAAAYRIFDLFGWSEIIYNHLTAKIPGKYTT